MHGTCPLEQRSAQFWPVKLAHVQEAGAWEDFVLEGAPDLGEGDAAVVEF